MPDAAPHRKTLRHFDEPGHFHELTFSCYRRLPLLTNDVWRTMLSEEIDAGLARSNFHLAGFVYMPEHVHLLLYAGLVEAQISSVLKSVKQPFSRRVKALLEESASLLVSRLTIQERPGKQVFRFWQEGGGYDRNLIEPKAIYAALEYIHLNPVRRGLVQRAIDWRWSSCRFYEEPDSSQDSALPRIHGLPALDDSTG